VWIRGIAGIVLCALGALWIAQGSGAVHGSAMSGHGQFTLLGGVVVIVGLALLLWALRIRHRAHLYLSSLWIPASGPRRRHHPWLPAQG
jgi:hypothetical protein